MDLLLFRVAEDSLSVHLSPLPLALVLSTVRPSERAFTVPLVVQIFSFVDTSIGPSVFTASVHVACKPLTLVMTPVKPLVRASALHFIVDPVSGVEGAVWPEICPKAILLTLREVAVEARTISPAFNALSVVKVVFPLSDVPLFSILGLKRPEPVCLVALPVPFVGVPVWTPKLSFSVCLVIEPFSFVLGAIGPVLNSIGALFTLFIDVTRVESLLDHFDIFDKLQAVLLNHAPEFFDLLL